MKWEFGRQNLSFWGALVFNRLLLSMKNLNSKILFKKWRHEVFQYLIH